MVRTLVAVFDDIKEAEATVQELKEAGFPREHVSIVSHRARCSPSVGPLEQLHSEGGSGAIVGGIAGFSAGVVALAIPGIGPILAAGPLAAGLLGGGLGAAAGAVIARLKEAGVPEADAGCYCEAVRRGGILLSLDVPEEKAELAEEIIGHHRLVDIEDCTQEWQKTGWKGFDPNAEPAPTGLPFDPSSLRIWKTRERQRRAVRQYFRTP